MYSGVLFIGDPHLSGRQPNFRKDDYPNTILEKLRWCLDYARSERLLPALLGDLFDHWRRDNPNWLIVRLIELLESRDVIGIYGNHDVFQNKISDDDSLSILVAAGRLTLVGDKPWKGVVGGKNLLIYGASWGSHMPENLWPPPKGTDYVILMTHHDVIVPGYEEQGNLEAIEIPGVDLVINGHIHRRLGEVRRGRTTWITPGNIARVFRTESSRAHVPSALRVDIGEKGWRRSYVEIPHLPYEDVFYEETELGSDSLFQPSAFVQGLAELIARKTASGAGLMQFLDLNLKDTPEEIRKEILLLAEEVIHAE